MWPMLLYKLIFASTFGRGAKHLFRAALLRVGSLCIGSSALGMILAHMLPPLPVQSGQTLPYICSGIFTTQLIVLITLFASYGIVRPGRQDVVTRLLFSWPVAPHKAWSALLIPGVILAVIAVGFIAPSMYSLLGQLGVSWWLCSICILLGCLSALGVIYGISRRFGYLQGIIGLLLIGAEYYLLRLLYQEPSHLMYVSSLAGWSFLTLFGVSLLVSSLPHLASDASHASPYRRVHLQFLPASYWFIKKVSRGYTTRIGIITTLIMSMILGLLSWRMSFSDLATMSSIMSLLAAAFVSDIRTLVQRHTPVEIAGLRGLAYFMRKQITAALTLSVLATGPLISSVLLLSWPLTIPDIGTIIGVPLLLGVASGIFASALIAPGPRDITAQSTATLLAAGLFILPQLSAFSQPATRSMIIIKLTLVVALLMAAIFIEYKRNPFVWRKSHVR
jgi:hypothetical protein